MNKDGKDIGTRSPMAPKISSGEENSPNRSGEKISSDANGLGITTSHERGGEEFTIRSPKARGNHDEL